MTPVYYFLAVVGLFAIASLCIGRVPKKTEAPPAELPDPTYDAFED